MATVPPGFETALEEELNAPAEELGGEGLPLPEGEITEEAVREGLTQRPESERESNEIGILEVGGASEEEPEPDDNPIPLGDVVGGGVSPLLQPEGEPDLFAELKDPTEQTETIFDDVPDPDAIQTERPALATTSLLAALARIDVKANPTLAMGEETLAEARRLLELGNEKQMRIELAGKQIQEELRGIEKLRANLGPLASEEDVKAVAQAYGNVLQHQAEDRAARAFEDEAFRRIQEMAARDPVSANVLLDNLDPNKGNADQTVQTFWVKQAKLAQVAERLSAKHQDQSWAMAALVFTLNLVPLNYNAARSSVVPDSGRGFWDFFRTGEGQRKESERLSNMPMDEYMEYMDSGRFEADVENNATTVFDMFSDPRTAVEIVSALAGLSDSDRHWNNGWGIAEPLFLLPINRIIKGTKALASAGASRAATENLANAVRILDTEGPEAMARRTGVDEAELADSLSVSGVTPRAGNDVPFSEQVATREVAARQALEEIFNPESGMRFNSIEEIQAAYDARVLEISGEIGRPIKNVEFKVENLANGGSVRYVDVTFGKKNGHGYARSSTAENAGRSMGISGEAVEGTVQRARVYHGNTSATIRASDNGNLGQGAYVGLEPDMAEAFARRAGDEGATVHPVSVRPDKIFGWDKIKSGWTVDDIKGAIGELGITAKQAKALLDRAETAGGAINSGEVIDEFARILAKRTDDLNTHDALNEVLKNKGYHGVGADIGGNAQAVVFDVNNLKPAFGKDEVFRDASGQFFFKSRFNIGETQFLTNELHTATQGFLSNMFGRWVRAMPRISDPDLHGRAVAAGSQINRAHKVIETNMLNTFKKLPKASFDLVKQVALKGANQERWFTPDEFDFLVDRMRPGKPATALEKEAYQNLQKFNDMDWVLRNDTIYMEKVLKDIETARFKTPWGRDMEMDVKINRSPDKVPSDRVYNMSDEVHYTKQHNPLSAKELDRLRNNGYVMLSVTDEAFDIPFGTRNIKVNHILVKRSDIEIAPLRRNQLNYTAGGHRMYVDKYFVKQGRRGKQGDTGTEYLISPNTFITAPNKAEAARWASVMDRARILVKEQGATAQRLDDDVFQGNQAFPSGEEFLQSVADDTINLDEPFEAVFNREMPSMYQKSGDDITRMFNEDELGVNGYYRTTGKMYTSAKGAHLKDHTGNLASTVDPYEALATSLRQITRQGGLFSYKTEALARFNNTYGQFMDMPPNTNSPAQLLTEGRVRPEIPMNLRNQIESQRAAILNVLRFETPQEKLRTAMYRNAAEWALGNSLEPGLARKAAHDAVWWWKDSNPIASMRGFAFDAKLGMFNVAQLLIQSSTMISATALSPKYGMRGMFTSIPMHLFLIKGGSENVLDAMVKRGTWKNAGFNSPEEFKEYARHLHQSGFTDMNGSHIMINDYGPQAHFGGFGDKVDHFRETGRTFFYTAETYNRLVAYRIAWGEATDAGLRVGDPKFNSTVLRLADDYSMNMTQESSAAWQKGLMSIPTQFWAYNVRMLDAMVGKRFTPAQKTRLLLANAAMAGTAGVPGLGALSMYLKQEKGEGFDIDTIEGAADRGLIDALIYHTTGADILAGERVGTGGWVTDTAKAMFGYSEFGEKSLADMLGGATYSIGKSTVQGVGGMLWSVGQYAAAESGGDMGEKAMMSDSFIKMLGEISTFNNVTKAMLVANYGMYKSKNGTILADDLPATDAVAVALSFRPAPAEEIGYKLKYIENSTETLKEVSTQLRNWRQEAFNNPDKFEENMAKANVLMKLLPPADRAAVIKRTNSITDDSFYDYLERKVADQKMKEGIPE